MMSDYLERDSDSLDGFEFLTMAEASGLATGACSARWPSPPATASCVSSSQAPAHPAPPPEGGDRRLAQARQRRRTRTRAARSRRRAGAARRRGAGRPRLADTVGLVLVAFDIVVAHPVDVVAVEPRPQPSPRRAGAPDRQQPPPRRLDHDRAGGLVGPGFLHRTALGGGGGERLRRLALLGAGGDPLAGERRCTSSRAL